MTEPDVTLTDYGLAIECGLFVYLLLRHRHSEGGLQTWFVVFFGSILAASLFGGSVHGFFLDEPSLGNRILWPLTLLSIGVTALSGWMIGAILLFAPRTVRWIRAVAYLQFAVYAGVVVFFTREFRIAVVVYLPAALFLLVAFAMAYRREHGGGIGPAAQGMLLTFIASAVQQLEIAVHRDYFNHNALYHVILAIALFLIFLGARELAVGGARLERAEC